MKTLVLATLVGAMLAVSSAIPQQRGLIRDEAIFASLGQNGDHSQAAPRTTNYPCMDYNPAKRTCGLHQNQEPSWLSNDTLMDG
jgi:hypothetical protein